MQNEVQKYQPLTVLSCARLAAPHTWPGASVLPVGFAGVACLALGYSFNAVMWCALLLFGVLTQAAVNTLNDYADFKKGTDGAADGVDPSDAVLVFENPNPRHVLALGAAELGVAFVLGVVCMLLAHTVVPLLFGLVGCAVVVLYSFGRTPISYLPLGEVVSGVTMGYLLPLGCLLIMAGLATHTSFEPFALIFTFPWGRATLLSAPFVIGIGMVMATQNTCDVERDTAAGRHTVPVVLGHARAVTLYRAVLIFWIATVAHLAFWYARPGFFLVLTLLALGLGTLRAVFTTPLVPAVRVPSMVAVNKANLFINGGYVLALMFSLI